MFGYLPINILIGIKYFKIYFANYKPLGVFGHSYKAYVKCLDASENLELKIIIIPFK